MATRYLGLMSGTSLDGIDAALVQVDERDGRLGAFLEAFLSLPYTSDQRQAIKEALTGTPQQLCRVNFELGGWFAEAALRLLEKTGVAAAELAAVGSHGQTIWHEPPSGDVPGGTLQLGEPAVIADWSRSSISCSSRFPMAGARSRTSAEWRTSRCCHQRPHRSR